VFFNIIHNNASSLQTTMTADNRVSDS